MATSTLELGVDVGDLDRVIQIGAPRAVASLLQRLGRTGRRGGTRPNMLLLATDDDELLQAAGVLRLWGEGYVEPVVPPPSPRQLVAQQLLALCLQQGRVGDAVWHEWLGGLPLARSHDEVVEVARWLVETGHVDHDSGMLYIGPQAERRLGGGTSWSWCRCSSPRRRSPFDTAATRSARSTQRCCWPRWKVPG